MRLRLRRAAIACAFLSSSALLAIPPGPAAAQAFPSWYGAPHRTSIGADIVARRMAQGLQGTAAANGLAGAPCKAETSTGGNVQVNCLAEDGMSAQHTQSETSVAAVGSKVV